MNLIFLTPFSRRRDNAPQVDTFLYARALWARAMPSSRVQYLY